MKMETREVTTDAVVDSPTPFAPPVVVCPIPQLMVAMTPPNANPLEIITETSDEFKYFAAESKMMLGVTPYRRSARRILAAMAMEKEMTERMGSEIAHATTLGTTK